MLNSFAQINIFLISILKKNYLIILVLIALSFLFHRNHINEFPSGIHAWAQTDRYALAIGFTRNGLNFFKPESFNLNPQFPPTSKPTTNQGITAVDFPIHDYIPALIMIISDTLQPWCFRLYILIYSLIGLYFLYLVGKDISGNRLMSMFIVLFAVTSPVFIYYQVGFLPTIPSVANISIAYYFYFKHIESNSVKNFVISIFFFTLAALSRTPFVIYLVAVCVQETQSLIVQKNKFCLKKFMPIFLSFLILIGYFLYNSYLRTKYGSIFLNYPLPPENFQSFTELLKITLENWKLQYFTKYHYIALLLIAGINLYLVIFKNRALNKIQKILLLHIIVLLFFYSVNTFLMLRQFPAHDYYFLDTFYFITLLLIIYMFSNVKLDNKYNMTGFTVILVIISIGMIQKSAEAQKVRRNTGYLSGTEITKQNFLDSEEFLNYLGISYSSKILVIDAHAPNLPFILMNRKGYAILTTSKENIAEALKWDYDYIIIQDIFLLSDVVIEYPDIIQRIEKIAGNGKISVYKLSKEIKNKTLLEFLKLDQQKPFFRAINNFDNQDIINWENTNLVTNIYAYSGSFSGFVDNTHIYGVTFSLSNNTKLLTQTRMILFKGIFYAPTRLQNCELVVQIDTNGSKAYYRTKNLKSLIKEQKKWININLLFPIPMFDNVLNNELKIYVWNPGKTELYYDNFEIFIY